MVVAVEARGHPLPMDSTSHPANLTHPPSRVVVSLISRCILHMLSAILLSTDLTPNTDPRERGSWTEGNLDPRLTGGSEKS